MSTTESGQQKSIDQLVKNPLDGLTEKTIQEPTKKGKKIILGIIILFCILLVIYLGFTKYFTNHFYFGSEINSVNVSGKTVAEAEAAVKSKLQNYTLTLKEREGKTEQIKSNDIGLNYNSDEEFSKLKNRQNPFKWVLAPFNAKDSKMAIGISYDNNLLKNQLDKLSCINGANIVEPKSPSFKYENNKYVIINEVIGNTVDKNALYSHITDSMLNGKTEIDLNSAGCYINPKYTSKSEKTSKVKDTLDKYVASKITYNFRGNKETIDGSIINTWLSVDNNLEINFNTKKVKTYLNGLSETYDTVGKTRSFVTSTKNTINIGGGDYGWSISSSKETQSLIKAIQDGKTITKDPIYSQTASTGGSNDIGNTYVEVSFQAQHLWFYKNGSLVTEGDVVTGNVSTNHSTPAGIYSLKYKEKNATLKGQDYSTPVDFWMPFNGGIGLHDAPWRNGIFGGNQYLTNGSHGCVNLPPSLANTIFDNISPGTPVICY